MKSRLKAGDKTLTAPGRGPRVLVIGDVIDDILVRLDGPLRPDTDTGASIQRRPGGSAANVAAWLGAQGVAVEFIGRVGAGDGARHAAELAAHGVRARLVEDAERPTGTIVVLLDADGNRSMLTDRGANLGLSLRAVPDAALAAARVVHLTGYSLFPLLAAATAGDPTEEPSEAIRTFIDRAHSVGAIVTLDPSSTGFLADIGPERLLAAVAGVDMLFPNRAEAALLSAKPDPLAGAVALARRFPTVAVTLGADGALVVTREAGPVRVPAAPPVPACLDPTGAGDAFVAGYLAAWADGHAVEACARHGAARAAHAIGTPGGRPAAPGGVSATGSAIR